MELEVEQIEIDPVSMEEINKRPYYKSTAREIIVFEHAYKNRLPVLLKGQLEPERHVLLNLWPMNWGRN